MVVDACKDGSKIVSGSFDGTVRVWDAASGQEVRRMEGHSGAVESVAWSAVRCDGHGVVFSLSG